MPYALSGLAVTALAFLVLSLTGSTLLAWSAVFVGLAIFVIIGQKITK
ncbi:MAG: hypothetical protein ACRCZC_06850 [Culicoidibacterales bacterium]